MSQQTASPQSVSSAVDWVQRFNQGAALFNAGRHAEAEVCFRDAAHAQPNHPVLLLNHALTLRVLGRQNEALEAFTQVLRLDPNHADALFQVAGILTDLHRGAEAVAAYRALAAVRPDYPEAMLSFGNLLMRMGNPEVAELAYRQAVACDPASASATNNLGAAILMQNRHQDTAPIYRRGVRLAPDSAEYHKNLGTCQMMDGKYEEGTREYEWRVEQPVWKWKRDFPGKLLWDGSPLQGKTILVHFEQGLGDSFQYIRYMPVLQAMGARVVFECQPILKRVLSSAPGVDVLIGHGEPIPDFDCYVSLMSLMHRLGTTPDTVPGGVPYIHAEPELKTRWRARMDLSEFRVGINWQGNETAKSIPLELFLPISRIPGVRLYNLQKVNGLDQLERLRGTLPLVDWTAEMDTGPDAFLDTTAVMANMDLVLTCDTSVVHLAGAMGCPIVMPLKWFADWRWLREREDCPWYPTMRIFRMVRRNDWTEVMERVTTHIRRLVDDARR
ncbi:tetratricopeptide repeat protein [Azospirillum agricola]|uniref:tetratricopeptide repeat-containing glycosyltransferase family protein n=1 Tax=Azospirillum agricola TaxID=1720247 RepID=UPI000A0EF46A|nr:tetratricopeptide repeat-containing glycosyltransferase family protein [Azospirillum agricola]SMH41220.1 Tetratricopeptide repeat-containing protein [Azospirillum lipoferum]